MELVQLKYFQALAQSQHLTKTAHELHITPPALSVSIHRLEDELGVKLFDRVGRNLSLNACGRVLLDCVDRILQDLQDTRRALEDMQEKSTHIVSVFMRDPAFYHRDFQLFYENNPDIEFRQIGGDLDVTEELFVRENLDFVLTPVDLRDRPNLDCDVLYRDSFRLAVPPDHPLAKRESVSLAELRDEKFIGRSNASYFQEYVDQLCEARGFRPHYIMKCDYIMRAEMLSKGLGIAITTLHSSTTGYFGGAKFLKIDELSSEPYVFYVYRSRKKPLSEAALRFKAYLSELYEDMK